MCQEGHGQEEKVLPQRGWITEQAPREGARPILTVFNGLDTVLRHTGWAVGPRPLLPGGLSGGALLFVLLGLVGPRPVPFVLQRLMSQRQKKIKN